jgi:hypothetical protein
MKTTSVTMKNEFVRFLEDLGLPLHYIVNGVVGGFIWSIYRKLKFWDALRQIIIGGIVSGYFTPVVVAKTNLGDPFIGFTSFVVGMLGMVIIDSIYKYAVSQIKKWKDAIVFINTKK